jgi:hypothetical protein
MASTNPRRRSILEIAAVVATGATFLVFENVLHRKLEFLVPCTLLWAGYLLWRIRAEPDELKRWGLRSDNLREAVRASIPVFVLAVAGLTALRLYRGWRGLPPTALLVMAAYPVWGLIQQFLVQGLVTINLARLGLPRTPAVAISALLFGSVHLPDVKLSLLCVGAGAVWAVLFLRIPNLIPLALAHAWLGALTYYWVLERDPWRELFP